MAKVKRTINFFKVQLGKSIGNEMRLYQSLEDVTKIAMHAYQLINSLNFDIIAQDSRYLELTNGDRVSMYLDSNFAGKIEGRIVRCRYSLLPEIEKNGNLTSLELDEDASLAEITHFVYYYQQSIMAVEFNFYGPKSSHIGEYFRKKLGDSITMFSLTPIIENAWQELLDNNNYRLTMCHFAGTRSAASVLRKLNENLGVAFEAAATASDAECIEVVLRRRPKSRGSFSVEGFNWSNFFENNFLHREEFIKASVGIKNEDEKLREIDLLANKICVRKDIEIADERTRKLVSEEAYKAISSAFEECEGQLLLQESIG